MVEVLGSGKEGTRGGIGNAGLHPGKGAAGIGGAAWGKRASAGQLVAGDGEQGGALPVDEQLVEADEGGVPGEAPHSEGGKGVRVRKGTRRTLLLLIQIIIGLQPLFSHTLYY